MRAIGQVVAVIMAFQPTRSNRFGHPASTLFLSALTAAGFQDPWTGVTGASGALP
jgi:hypothetical protein